MIDPELSTGPNSEHLAQRMLAQILANPDFTRWHDAPEADNLLPELDPQVTATLEGITNVTSEATTRLMRDMAIGVGQATHSMRDDSPNETDESETDETITIPEDHSTLCSTIEWAMKNINPHKEYPYIDHEVKEAISQLARDILDEELLEIGAEYSLPNFIECIVNIAISRYPCIAAEIIRIINTSKGGTLNDNFTFGRYFAKVVRFFSRAGVLSEASRAERLRELQKEAYIFERLKEESQTPEIIAIIEDTRDIIIISTRLDGQNLEALLADESISVVKLLELFIELCFEYDKCHESGIIHRDIKPTNVLITPDTIPYILDFGCANCSDVSDFVCEKEDTIFGTPLYLAPELIAGTHKPSVLTDVYALGVSLYYCLVNDFPHDGAHTTQVMRNAVHNQPKEVISELEAKFLKKSDGKTPEKKGDILQPALIDLGIIIMKAIRKVQAERYQNMLQLAEALEDFLEKHENAIGRLWVTHTKAENQPT